MFTTKPEFGYIPKKILPDPTELKEAEFQKYSSDSSDCGAKLPQGGPSAETSATESPKGIQPKENQRTEDYRSANLRIKKSNLYRQVDHDIFGEKKLGMKRNLSHEFLSAYLIQSQRKVLDLETFKLLDRSSRSICNPDSKFRSSLSSHRRYGMVLGKRETRVRGQSEAIAKLRQRLLRMKAGQSPKR